VLSSLKFTYSPLGVPSRLRIDYLPIKLYFGATNAKIITIIKRNRSEGLKLVFNNFFFMIFVFKEK